MKIHIFKGHDYKWYFHIKGRNGKIMAQSEGYNRRSGAVRAILRLRILFSGDEI